MAKRPLSIVIPVAALTVLGMGPTTLASAAELPVVNVGVVIDGSNELNSYVWNLTRTEITTLTEDEFDVPGRRIYLSSAGEGSSHLFVADLSEDSPKPQKLLDLPHASPATAIYSESSRQRLFVAQGQSGTLWEVDLRGEAPEPHLVVDDLGWLAALGYGRRTQRLYVTDVANQTIWALDCRDRCKEPTVFLQSDSLKNPITLEVALDGTLWLGDLQEQTLVTIAPDGTVKSTIRSLSGDRGESAPPR